MGKIIGWFSTGITSAVACKMALRMYDNVELYYIDTGSQDEDSTRFFNDCQRWFGKDIIVVKNNKYENHFDAIEKRGFINSPGGAACTKVFKKDMRYKIQDDLKEWDGQVFGFDISETKRAKRFTEQNPDAKGLYPLIERNISKDECAAMLLKEGIELPLMYRLGYSNNNCVGCVKGGIGYWNKIRKDFPENFNRMAALERKVGASCLTQEVGNRKHVPLFLDELHPDRGRYPTEVMPECGIFCEIEFMNLK